MNKQNRWHRKLMLAMVVAMSLSVNAQKLTSQYKNEPLKSVFKNIEQQTGYSIIYNSNDVNLNRKVTASFREASLDDVLKTILESNLSFQLQNKMIVISRKDKQGVSTQSKKSRVVGRILDEKGEPIIGANVVEKGTTNGVITDFDGNFSLTVPSNGTLDVTYIGYVAQQVGVNNRENLKIVMHEDTKQIDEVVVVGYGTQKKPNLTGSVAMVGGDDLLSRPSSSVGTAIQGLLPGVTVSNYSGQPGASSADIKIRGIGTIGNANPLVLIDGVEGNLNILNPEDIESISVLKDAASSAIYGARGANGVILVTTKKVNANDNNSPTINFSGYFGLQTPTRKPKMLSSAEYMIMEAEAQTNVGQAPTFNENDLRKVILGTDPNYFANTNWVDEIYRSSAPQQNYALNISGSNKNIGYYLSYSYLDQEGLTVGNSTESNRHNIRMKLNTKVLDRVSLDANMSYTDRNYTQPSSGFTSAGGAIYTAMRISPLIPSYFTDGKWGYGGSSANPVALLSESGYNRFESQEFSGNFSAKLDIMTGWTAGATYSLIRTNSLRKILERTINYYYPHTEEVWYTSNPKNKYENRDYVDLKQTLILQTNYEKQLGDHNISGLLGFSQEWDVTNNFQAWRNNLISESFENIQSGSNAEQFNSADASQWAIRSGFTRLNYNYKERYLLEGNIRYDMSSRFSKDNRAGWFPSFSAGWRVTEEPFMEKVKETMDNLKVRASWGILGNQYVGSSNYPYMTSIQSVSVPTIGTGLNDGYMQKGLPNPALKWETINMVNVGVDMSFLNNRLSVSGDWFHKRTNDILLKLTYPGVLGTEPTEVNAGIVQNRGWEIDLKWNDRIGSVSYGVGVNISDVRNKIISLAGSAPSIDDYSIRKEGESINAFYGLVSDGLASVSDFERYNSSTGRYEGPKFPILDSDKQLVQPGDIKYKDLDGDGVITMDKDRKVIGSPIPRYTYSVNGNMAWKGLDFSFIIQGVGKADGYVNGAGRHAFIDASAYPQEVHRDRWTMENQNPGATYPRFTQGLDYNQRFSSFWLENASYLRLKNVQVGYTLPAVWTKKARIQRCRFYFSADNLLTVSDFFNAYDPETPVTKGGYYPQVKTFVFGLNLTFN